MVWAVEEGGSSACRGMRIPIERILVERGRHVNNDGRIGVDGKRHMTMHQPGESQAIGGSMLPTPTLLYYSAE